LLGVLRRRRLFLGRLGLRELLAILGRLAAIGTGTRIAIGSRSAHGRNVSGRISTRLVRLGSMSVPIMGGLFAFEIDQLIRSWLISHEEARLTFRFLRVKRTGRYVVRGFRSRSL
jgi:hypothetical protein